MKHFYIIANRIKDKDLTVAGEIEHYLTARGCRCLVETTLPEKEEHRYHYTDPDRIPEDIQCVIVLGGDGTLLQAARDVVDRQIPLLGINLGTLGYLAEIDRQNILPALDRLMGGEYQIEHRMMLCGRVYRGDRLLEQDIALNDIVIGGLENFSIIELNNYVNGKFFKYVPGGRDHHRHAHRFYRVQPFGGRASDLALGVAVSDDAAGAPYPEYQEHRSSS